MTSRVTLQRFPESMIAAMFSGKYYPASFVDEVPRAAR